MADAVTATLTSLSLGAATFAERFTLPSFRLRIVAGPDAGFERVFARRVVVVGSGAECDLVLDDGAVSRRHLRIEGQRGGYRVTDLDSKNGTWFAGARLGEVMLGAAATLRLGQTEMTYEQLPELHEVRLSREPEFGGLKGQSAAMREVFALLAQWAGSDVTVAIDGEPGSGKQLAAEGLHQNSARRDGPLCVLDAAALSPEDLDRELQHPEGALRRAHGGTLVLMGLDELPPSLQVPLLPLLGGVDGAPRAVRWVVTLQRPLPQALREERLHGDVARLLAPHTVSLPPLRHRLEDLPLLVDHLLQQVQVRRGDPLPKTLSWQTLQALQAYPWPGNVTELRRHLERAAQLATSADGPVHLDAPSATEATPPAPKHGLA
jgi:DNA-binding NtrC family response regulator